MKIIKVKTLNEAIAELGDKNYGVMNHNLADALRDEKENKKKAADMMVEVGKTVPMEDRDAHTKVVKTPELKKMHLAESLFEELDEALNLDQYGKAVKNAIKKLVLDSDEELRDFVNKIIDEIIEERNSDKSLNEAINGNTSHADEFISALRSAGFGDGFDQKLKIDTYGNGGTRIEFKDQGGTFTVTITDDKVVLEGQDEGEEPFKNEYTEWSKFVTEFNDLYPGIPVGEDLEDCQRYPVEGTKQVDLTLNEDNINENKEELNEASYTRSDDKKMLVKPNRDPLVDVIQMALTDGEWGYVKSPDGTITPSLLPHLSYSINDIGVAFDRDGRYFVRVWDATEEALQKVVDVAKQFNREYRIGLDKYARGGKKWYCLIYLNEDTDFDDPYVDPDAEVNTEGIKGRGTSLRGNPEARHARDNEDLEDSQRYPIESPVPAQTGLALMENESLEEDVQMNGSLMEDKISIDMIHDFKPQEGTAEETFNRILEAGKMETFEFTLEDRFPNGVTAEELNKILSEESQWVYNQLGMKEYLIPDEEEL